MTEPLLPAFMALTIGMIKIIIALMLGFMIGALCRWFDIPVPAPPQLLGVLLIASITVGYLLTDHFIARRTTPAYTSRNAHTVRDVEARNQRGEAETNREK